MSTRHFFPTLSILVLFVSLFACTKPDQELVPTPVNDPFKATIPDGNRIIIHFGTSTMNGCMYSFSNCIWIGWGTATELNRPNYTLLLNNSDEVNAEYGRFFPLTADFNLDAHNGLPAQVIKSGFYPFQLTPDGRTIIEFSPGNLHPVAPLVNPNNPQDNVGQLHNLAMQSIYTAQSKDQIGAPGVDQQAAREILTSKSVQFLANEADLVIDTDEQSRIRSAAFNSDYDNHSAWLASSSLSANDRKELQSILDMASAMQVDSPDQLSQFVQTMTEVENRLAKSTTLDDPKRILSAVSVLKYSRYYWFWKTATNNASASRKDWWKADVKGLLQGGLGQAIVDSLLAALTK